MATVASMTPPPVFNRNEKRMQRAAGIDPQRMEEQGQRFIRSQMPEQHQEFFCNQQFLLLGVTSREGRPVARAVVGPRGFISSPDSTKLTLQPLQRLEPELFRAGSPIGVLGIELETRRRNRVNGVIDSCTGNSLAISVRQSFGNCPKYIQVREMQLSSAAAPAAAREETGGAELGEAQRRFVERADTFFVATSYAGSAEDAGDPGAAYIGCDVSHRGGPPGFVRVLGPSALVWPDYTGNFFFQTLGNILANGRVGLLFIDFCTGDTLHISGAATLDLEDRSLPGAQRSVAVRVLNWTHAIGALPLRAAGPPQPSPYNPVAADGGPGAGAERLFVRCKAVIDEAAGIKTFVFAAPEPAGMGKAVPLAYKPGQYASFDFQGLEGEGRVTNRTWTISSHPDESAKSGTFSITVKRAGAASSWLHARPAAAIALEWRGSDGEFTLRGGAGPALLIAGGIGITPMRTMLKELAKRGNAVTLLYSVRAAAEAAFLQELARAAQASGGRIQLHTTVTGRDDAWAGHKGRIDAAYIKQRVPDLAACTAYMCGPDAFMEAVGAALQQLHFPSSRLHQESFAF